VFAIVAGIVVLVAQGELYFALQKRHYQPATALGLVAGALVLGAGYYRGESAMLAMTAIGVFATFLWFMTVPAQHRRNVVSNIGLTVLGIVWIPLFAGYALAMLKFPDGRGVVLATLGLTIAYDASAFAVGYFWGSRPLSPTVSPKKSWEGAIGATLVGRGRHRGVAAWVPLLDTIGRLVGLAVSLRSFAPRRPGRVPGQARPADQDMGSAAGSRRDPRSDRLDAVRGPGVSVPAAHPGLTRLRSRLSGYPGTRGNLPVMRTLVILGSTGSVGTQALDVVRRNPDRFKVVGLSAGTNQELLVGQIREFLPPYVAIMDEEAATDLKEKLSGIRGVEILVGPEAAETLARDTEADLVLNALVGSAGLAPTLAALQAGKTLALAQGAWSSAASSSWISSRGSRSGSCRSTPSTPGSRSACGGSGART
jgi:hypothetical protein